MSNLKKVSIIIPIFNEQKYIRIFLNSCLNQDFPLEQVEFLLIDGGSTDQTIPIINEYIHKYPNVFRLLINQKKYTPFALNLGIREAFGEYILIMACHSDYDADFISKSVSILQEVEADIVGGVTKTKSRTFIGDAMSLILSSKFGVGNSAFRTGKKDGYVDTVFCGACSRNVYEKYGMFDERLIRNQDLEFNKRVINQGGKVYLSNQIKLTYYTPDTLSDNLKKAYSNGKWNIYTLNTCSGIISIRHLVPCLFVLSLIFLPLISLIYESIKYFFYLDICLYGILDLLFTIKNCLGKTLKYWLVIPFLYPLFHISYGFGSLNGILYTIYQKIRRKK